MRTIVIRPEIHPFDIDAMGHVSNIVFVRWMEIGRCKLLDEVGMSVHSVLKQGLGPALVDTQISYKHQLKLGDSVRLEVWLSEIAKASAWLEFLFSNEQGIIFARGRQRGIFLDFEKNRPRRLDKQERALFEQFLKAE